MRSFKHYLLNEGLTNKQIDLIGEIFSKMFSNTKLSKENIKSIFVNLDKDIIQTISNYFNNNESENYLSYAPNDDEFLDWNNSKDKIIDQISEYMNKYKCN